MSFASRRSSVRIAPIALAAALATAAAPPASAQGETKFEWQKRAATFNFGVPRVGKHTIDELKVGETWRCGANGITTLTIDAPLLTADGVVAPGVYRINVARQAAEKFELTIEGAGTRLAAGGDNVAAAATLVMEKKPNEKLEMDFSPAKEQADAELRALELSIQFGAPHLSVPLTIVGTQPLKAKGFAVDAFKLPEAWLKKRLELAKLSPVLTLTRTGKVGDGVPAKLNLLLGEKEVLLLPTMEAPTENRGFGAIPQPDAAWILKGTVAWSDAAKPADHFRVDSAEVEKDLLHVVAAVGARTADIKVGTVPSKEKATPGATTPTKN